LVFPNGDLVPEKYKDLWFSHEQNANAPILDKDAIDAIGVHLQPDSSSPLYSPFNSKTPHKGLPRTYVSVDGLDPLRDDGLIYEQVLREAGVKTRLDVWPGVSSVSSKCSTRAMLMMFFMSSCHTPTLLSYHS
jgi:acetyl esterase/lipase